MLAYFLTHYKSTPEFKKADIEKMNTGREGSASSWTTHSIMRRRRVDELLVCPSVAGKSSSPRSAHRIVERTPGCKMLLELPENKKSPVNGAKRARPRKLVVRAAIEAELSSKLDAKLVKELLDAHAEAKRNFYLGGLRLSAVEGGRFCEAVFGCCKTSPKGSARPFLRLLPKPTT